MYKKVVKGEWPSVGRQNGLKGSMNSFSGLLTISLDFIHVLWHDLKNKQKKIMKIWRYRRQSAQFRSAEA